MNEVAHTRRQHSDADVVIRSVQGSAGPERSTSEFLELGRDGHILDAHLRNMLTRLVARDAPPGWLGARVTVAPLRAAQCIVSAPWIDTLFHTADEPPRV